MKSTRFIISITAVAALSAISGAQAIFDQLGTGSGVDVNGFASQNIPDFAPNYNIMALEDITTTSAYKLTSIDMVGFFYNTATPDPANITGWQFAVFSNAVGNGGTTDTSNTGDVLNGTFASGAVTVTANFNGVTGNYLFHLDLSSANMTLAAGTYWFGMAADLPFGTGGQLAVAGNTMSDASSGALNARQMNGGGGFAITGNNAATDPAANLSYRLNGAPVPEPASMAALGLGALALIRKRRNRKA